MLGIGRLDRCAQRAQFASHLGRRGGRRRRGCDVIEEGRRRGAFTFERRFVVGQFLVLRFQSTDRGHHFVEFGAQSRRICFEIGNDPGVHHLTPIAFVGTATFDQQHGDSSCSFTQLLDAHQFVAETTLAPSRQFGFGGHHVGVEFGQESAKFFFLAPGFGAVTGQRLEASTESGDLTSAEEQSQGIQLGDQITMTTCGFGLTLERPQLTTHFAQQVLNSKQRPFGGFETPFGFLLALAKLQNAGGFFDDGSTIFGTRVQHRVDLPLTDDDVLLATHTGVGQQLLNIEQSARDAIDAVFALTGSIEHTTDADLGDIDGQQSHRVVEGEGDLCSPEGRTLGRSGENDVVHLLGTHRTGGLGAENPRNGIDHIGLTGTVGTHHHGDPRFEVHHGVVGEGLEAFEGERLEKHDAPTLVHRGRSVPSLFVPSLWLFSHGPSVTADRRRTNWTCARRWSLTPRTPDRN